MFNVVSESDLWGKCTPSGKITPIFKGLYYHNISMGAYWFMANKVMDMLLENYVVTIKEQKVLDLLWTSARYPITVVVW